MSIASRMLSNHLILWYFYFCFQSFPALGLFRMSQVFASGRQSTGASASVFQMNIQDWFSLGLTGLISLLSEGLSGVFSITTIWKHQFLGTQPLYGPTLTFIHDYCKNHVAVQLLSHVWLFVTPWTGACQEPLSFTISQSLLKLMFIEMMMPSNHLILCHPPLFLPSIFPSIRVIFNEMALYIRWPKYWSFSFSISLSNEYSGLISFRIDWFDHLAVQGVFSNTTVQKHQFFGTQLSSQSNTHIPTIPEEKPKPWLDKPLW